MFIFQSHLVLVKQKQGADVAYKVVVNDCFVCLLLSDNEKIVSRASTNSGVEASTSEIQWLSSASICTPRKQDMYRLLL
jgi:hypothetical protein